MRFWGVKGANESVDGASGDFHSFYNNHVHINSGGCIRDALMGSLAKGVDAAEAPLRSADGLLVINVAGIVEAGDGFYQLGPYLSQFVNDCGLFIIWKMDNGGGGGEDIVSDDSSSVATSLLMELSNVGLVAATFGDGTAPNYFDPLEGFAVYFEKKSYSIRNPSLADLKQLLQIDADSWKEDLRYSSAIMEGLIVNKSDDIIVMVNAKSEAEGDEIVGAMFTQKASNDLSLLDAEPWEVSISNSSRVRGSSGTVKQLMRVSTRGSGSIASYVGAGVVLRDYALVVAASQGINQVVS